MIDHVTLLSPARIEGRVAKDNFTPIVGLTTSSGFNVFASGWVLRSAGLKGSGHGGSDARASNAPGAYSFQSRSGEAPLPSPQRPRRTTVAAPRCPRTRGPRLAHAVQELPVTRRQAQRCSQRSAVGPEGRPLALRLSPTCASNSLVVPPSGSGSPPKHAPSSSACHPDCAVAREKGQIRGSQIFHTMDRWISRTQ